MAFLLHDKSVSVYMDAIYFSASSPKLLLRISNVFKHFNSLKPTNAYA